MFLKNIDLTTALRPALSPEETLLFVQDNVGLYEGKFKIPDHQNGHAYLTSHRVCYVDDLEPRKNSVGIDLKDVERFEFYAGFLKSSPKLTLFPKPPKRSSLHSRTVSTLTSAVYDGRASPISRTQSPFHLPPADPVPVSNATWICPICSFSNPVPSNFDPSTATIHTPLPPCLACGIKPPLAHVLKAAISSAVKPTTSATTVSNKVSDDTTSSRPYSQATDLTTATTAGTGASFQCPRCTFLNHPSLLSCELCGAPLLLSNGGGSSLGASPRSESPGPTLQHSILPGLDSQESIKISFRDGGEKVFHERLKGAITQRKWLLHGAPPVPKPGQHTDSANGERPAGMERTRTAGIAGLEQRRQELRKNNELVIGNAFEDLEALMASAKEIVALAESFARSNGSGVEGNDLLLAQSATALGLITTKDMLGGGNNSETLYLTELSRNLAEYLTDDTRGVLKSTGGIVTLVDLWAMFNRVRGGVELVSPMDFEKAARLWEKLRLPVRLRTFKSGVLVVQGIDRTDEKTIQAILRWLSTLHLLVPEHEVFWDWHELGRGITIQEAAEHFGWSIGVATEELEMAEQSGSLCREEGPEGLKYWENLIGTEEPTDDDARGADELTRNLVAELGLE